MTTVEQIESVLREQGFTIRDKSRTGDDKGWRLKLEDGQLVNVWDNGNWNIQGKNTAAVKEQINKFIGGPGDTVAARTSRNVFVVYGHDQNARNELEAMLRRWDLFPLLLDQLASEGQTIIEKLEKYQGKAEFAVVLATPDDKGFRAGHADEESFRCRQNVVLELGMMLAHLGRSKVAILLKDQETMERPSDIQGLIYIPFKDGVRETALQLAKEMNAQGLRIDINKI
jgi:predicted nucleotide-binding protein